MIENKEITAEITPQVFVLSKEVRKMLGIKLKPYIREKPKVQRNSPCPCGSGLKYKRCCLELNNLENNGTQN